MQQENMLCKSIKKTYSIRQNRERGEKFMDSFILFQQLLVLCALMLTGFIAYKTNLLDDHAYTKLSSFMVWILNPMLMISGALGKENHASAQQIGQNIMMVIVMYGGLFLLGFLYILICGHKKGKGYQYRMVMLFPNVGFMGVPLVKVIFGSEYIVYVVFYMLAFNLLCYTYGIHLASKMGERQTRLSLKKLLSPGFIASIFTILIFALQIKVPTPLATYVDYMGNTAITISMIIIGISLARMDLKSAFLHIEYYIFLIAKMLVVPILFILISNRLSIDPIVKGVFQILVSMPVASMTCMMAEEYAGDGSECAKIITITTICTVITAPLVILFAR